jgi:hypothetical protein
VVGGSIDGISAERSKFCAHRPGRIVMQPVKKTEKTMAENRGPRLPGSVIGLRHSLPTVGSLAVIQQIICHAAEFSSRPFSFFSFLFFSFFGTDLCWIRKFSILAHVQYAWIPGSARVFCTWLPLVVVQMQALNRISLKPQTHAKILLYSLANQKSRNTRSSVVLHRRL